MLKTIMFAIIAACSGSPNAPADKQPPPEEPPEDQHFCCTDIDNKTKSGEGCAPIHESQILMCSTILYCGGDWSLKDGKASCL